MTILSIAVGKCRPLNKTSTIYTIEYNLDKFSFLSRNSMKEACVFGTRLCFNNLDKSNFYIIEFNGYYAYCMIANNNLGCCVIMNIRDYSLRIVKSLLIECLGDFTNNIGDAWKERSDDFIFTIDSYKKYIVNYEKPENFDKIMQIQNKVDETKEVLYKSIDKILERGEKIEDLIAKTEDLSYSSKLFYKQSKKLNRCCLIL